MENLSDQPVSVGERAKIRRFLKLYMARYGQEGGEPLTRNAMGDRINKFINHTYGFDPDGRNFLSRNAVENFLERKTHTPDKKIQGIKAFLLSIHGFVTADQLTVDDPIDGAALAMCAFYGIDDPKPATLRSEERYVFTAMEADRKFTMEFSLGVDYEAPARAIYMPVNGSCAGELEIWAKEPNKTQAFGPIPCSGFGILSAGLLYLFLRAGVRRTPLIFAGGNPKDISVAAWLAFAEPKSDLFKFAPSVYQGNYRGIDEAKAREE